MPRKRKQTEPVPRKAEIRRLGIPDEIPVLYLVSEVVFPFGATLTQIRAARNLALVESLDGNEELVAVAFAPGKDPTQVTGADVGHIAVAGRVIGRLRLPNGTLQVTIHGLARIYISELVQTEPYLRARVACLVDQEGDPRKTAAARDRIMAMVEELARQGGAVQEEHVMVLKSNADDVGHFADLVAAVAPLDLTQRVEILGRINLLDRMTYLADVLQEKVHRARVLSEFDGKVKLDVERTQREFYLRRQLQLLQQELGEKSREQEAADQAETRLAEIQAPAEVQDAVRTEIGRLRNVHAAGPQFAVIRNHLDWLLGMPWSTSCPEQLDLHAVKKALDEDHFGLERPKQRILEHLAVTKLSPGSRNPVLCFLGPPGTGKTSLAQSVARALGRTLARISVGGIRDEAEIRGHRRTYVGALPGRIVQAIRKANCNNPLIVVDEIDKMAGGFQGDPRAAMLEVLDPEQNHAFVDHYLEVPVDLSRIFFVTTANAWWDIPDALRDRMEVIELSSYVAEEKVEIAKRHLVPQTAERLGLSRSIRIQVKALRMLISGYTSEAGVRQLGRRVEAVLRGLAIRLAMKGEKPPRSISRELVLELLGPPEILADRKRTRPELGVVNGLAWTQSGGDLLLIEAVRMPGTGEIQVTGSIGDVMRESVAAAVTYVRSRAEELQIPHAHFGEFDLHIHFPEGAVPKDGPSAGAAVTTVVTSLYTARPVRADVAMTGELNLRGDVLAIGGLQEKLSAAARLGVKTVLFPKVNEGELHWVRESVKKKLELIPVEHVSEVLSVALVPRSKK